MPDWKPRAMNDQETGEIKSIVSDPGFFSLPAVGRATALRKSSFLRDAPDEVVDRIISTATPPPTAAPPRKRMTVKFDELEPTAPATTTQQPPTLGSKIGAFFEPVKNALTGHAFQSLGGSTVAQEYDRALDAAVDRDKFMESPGVRMAGRVANTVFGSGTSGKIQQDLAYPAALLRKAGRLPAELIDFAMTPLGALTMAITGGVGTIRPPSVVKAGTGAAWGTDMATNAVEPIRRAQQDPSPQNVADATGAIAMTLAPLLHSGVVDPKTVKRLAEKTASNIIGPLRQTAKPPVIEAKPITPTPQALIDTLRLEANPEKAAELRSQIEQIGGEHARALKQADLEAAFNQKSDEIGFPAERRQDALNIAAQGIFKKSYGELSGGQKATVLGSLLHEDGKTEVPPVRAAPPPPPAIPISKSAVAKAEKPPPLPVKAQEGAAPPALPKPTEENAQAAGMVAVNPPEQPSVVEAAKLEAAEEPNQFEREAQRLFKKSYQELNENEQALADEAAFGKAEPIAKEPKTGLQSGYQIVRKSDGKAVGDPLATRADAQKALSELHGGYKTNLYTIEKKTQASDAATSGSGRDIINQDVPGSASRQPAGEGEAVQQPGSAVGQAAGGAGEIPVRKPGDGHDTVVLVPGEQTEYKARYRVRELADLRASHHGFSFEPNPDYPYTNERDYTKPEGQKRVIDQGRLFNWRYLITDNPDTANGPPVVDTEGNAIGGNSRVMTLQRVEAMHPEHAKLYREQLAQQAERYGIDPKELEGMKNPVLVRELDPVEARRVQKAISDMNKTGTAALSPSEEALSASRRVSPETLGLIEHHISQMEDGTLAKVLSGDRGPDIINGLVKDGVLTEREAPQYLANGKLTQEGKLLVTRLMTGRLFRDVSLMDSTPAGIKNKLERIVSPLAQIEKRPEWDVISGPIKEALVLLEEARAHNLTKLEDVEAQAGMFGQSKYSPEAYKWAYVLKNNTGKALTAAFKQYADLESLSRPNTNVDMFAPPPVPQPSAFEAAFGKLKDINRGPAFRAEAQIEPFDAGVTPEVFRPAEQIAADLKAFEMSPGESFPDAQKRLSGLFNEYQRTARLDAIELAKRQRPELHEGLNKTEDIAEWGKLAHGQFDEFTKLLSERSKMVMDAHRMATNRLMDQAISKNKPSARGSERLGLSQSSTDSATAEPPTATPDLQLKQEARALPKKFSEPFNDEDPDASIAGMQHRYYPARGRTPGRIYVDETGKAIVSQLRSKLSGQKVTVYGTAMSSTAAQAMALMLRKPANIFPGLSPEAHAGLSKLATVFDAALKDNPSGFIIASADGRPMCDVKGTVYHESAHMDQASVSGPKLRPIIPPFGGDYLKIPHFLDVQARLVRAGYSDHPDTIVRETLSIASENIYHKGKNKLGLTKPQMADTIKGIIKEAAKIHGDRAELLLRQMSPSFKAAVAEAK